MGTKWVPNRYDDNPIYENERKRFAQKVQIHEGLIDTF
jgi:hypothetical protein